VLLAAAGITFYAITPYTFGAFQASTFAIMPLLVIVLIWLHRRLPGWVQWTGAVIRQPSVAGRATRGCCPGARLAQFTATNWRYRWASTG
jgi:hypothetical protein